MRRELRSALWNRKLPLRAPEALIFRRIAPPAITPVIPSGVEGFRGAILKVTIGTPRLSLRMTRDACAIQGNYQGKQVDARRFPRFHRPCWRDERFGL